MIGSISLAIWLSITSVEYMSLNELVAILHGIRIINGLDKIANRTVYNHYFVNDLLGQRIPITQQQYDDTNLTTPSTS